MPSPGVLAIVSIAIVGRARHLLHQGCGTGEPPAEEPHLVRVRGRVGVGVKVGVSVRVRVRVRVRGLGLGSGYRGSRTVTKGSATSAVLGRKPCLGSSLQRGLSLAPTAAGCIQVSARLVG